MKVAAVVIAVVIVAALGYCSWRFERWVNWKLFYGGKVEDRIEMLEKRITELENQPCLRK